MKISTRPVDTERIREDLIVASMALMALKPYKANYDAKHDNYFISEETVENVKEELYSTLESIEKELHPMSIQISRNMTKGDPMEDAESIREDLRRIFAICDYCLSHKGDIDD